jgi:predicted outer membrane lipoprotein
MLSFESIKIVLLGIVFAVAYGIANDMVTARVCVEFYRLFPIDVQSSSPNVVAIVFGVITTWWVGRMSLPEAASA